MPLTTCNGDGLRKKTKLEKKAYIAVRDTRKYPSEDDFQGQGNRPPLLTDVMYGRWDLNDKTTAKLSFKEFSYSRPGVKVGKARKESMLGLHQALREY